MARKTSKQYISDLRQLSKNVSDAALVAVAAGHHRTAVFDASEKLSDIADRIERKNQAAVLVLPENATLDELHNARKKQSVRRSNKVYLPIWRSSARALPDVFLRTALFSSSSTIQKQNDLVISNDRSLIITNKEIDSFKNVCLIFSGYPLCQYDRQVYANCLDYYRERPLESNEAITQDYVETSFYEFANKMGNAFNAKTYNAIRASLIRLGSARLRLRQNSKDIDLPNFVSIKFNEVKDGSIKGSERFSLRVAENIGELFGVASWTAINNKVVDYTGLKGWVANFYATHSKSAWLPLESLYRISGYESRFDNFKNGLIKALDNLKDHSTHEDCRISKYELSKNKEKIFVVKVKGLTLNTSSRTAKISSVAGTPNEESTSNEESISNEEGNFLPAQP